jgi:chemotaxis response regulator CheB
MAGGRGRRPKGNRSSQTIEAHDSNNPSCIGFSRPVRQSARGRAPSRFARTRDRRDQNRANVWRRHDELSQALQRIASLTTGHPRAVAVGSSMGGPAAIRFAVAVRPAAKT